MNEPPRRIAPRLPLLALSVALALSCGQPETRADRLTGAPPEGEVAARTVAALAIPDSLERVAALAELLSGLGPESIPEVVEAFDYARPVLGDSEWMLLADWWTRYDARAAYGWVLSNRDHKTPGVLRYVIAGMTRTDPEGALLALATLRSPDQRIAAFQEIVKAWHEADPDAVLDHLIGLVPGADRQRAIETLVALRIRREGVETTQEWAEDLDDDLRERFKLQVFRRVASETALVDAASARAWAEKHADGDHGDGLYRRVAVRLITVDPAATMDWLIGLPSGAGRDEAIEEAYRRWVNTDRESAIAWMEAAPSGGWREPALEIYALSFGVEDPLQAMALLSSLKDDERRNYAKARVLIAWFATDREAAEAWLADAVLPEGVVRKVRERVAANDEREAKKALRAERQRLRREERVAREQPR